MDPQSLPCTQSCRPHSGDLHAHASELLLLLLAMLMLHQHAPQGVHSSSSSSHPQHSPDNRQPAASSRRSLHHDAMHHLASHGQLQACQPSPPPPVQHLPALELLDVLLPFKLLLVRLQGGGGGRGRQLGITWWRCWPLRWHRGAVAGARRLPREAAGLRPCMHACTVPALPQDLVHMLLASKWLHSSGPGHAARKGAPLQVRAQSACSAPYVQLHLDSIGS
jgi:hypothetical protein